jgi:hypothetical protein
MELAVQNAQLVTGPSLILPDGISLFFSNVYLITMGSSVGNPTIVDGRRSFHCKELDKNAGQ